MQNLRRHIDLVIEGMLDAPTRVVKSERQRLTLAPVTNPSSPVQDLIKPPDLNQARVNKCLIALVNRKIVTKENSTVRLRGFFLQAKTDRVLRELHCITGKEYRF